MDQTYVLVLMVTLFGLVFGSFLNVCITRLPRQESILAPRSRCPRCGKPIRWYDNIPVLSYLILRGRCRDCHEPISALYPLVELLTAAVWLAAFLEYGPSPEAIKVAVFGMLCLILVFTDLRERRIPHAVTLFGIAAGLALSFFIPVDNRPLEWAFRRLGFFLEGAPSSFMGALAGALVGGGLFYAVGEGFYILGGRQKEYLGFGDVMLMLMVGTFLGVPLTLLTILAGSVAGTLIALPLELAGPRFRHTQWPYGSFLGAAAIASSLAGKTVLDAYLRWAGLE